VPDGYTLLANARYWAGPPAIDEVSAVSDIGGRSTVDVFAAGELDWAPVGEYDAAWLAYDPDLGSSLRRWSDLTVTYYGFETQRPPFDDARVRRAFASGVDWRRIVELADGTAALRPLRWSRPGSPAGATRHSSGIRSGRGASAARGGGICGPGDLPDVTLVTDGAGYDEAILTQLRENLGITVRFEALDFGTLSSASAPGTRRTCGLSRGLPTTPRRTTSWASCWDRPAEQLRELVECRVRCRDCVGGRTDDPEAARAGYDAAESILREEVPTIP